MADRYFDRRKHVPPFDIQTNLDMLLCSAVEQDLTHPRGDGIGQVRCFV